LKITASQSTGTIGAHGSPWTVEMARARALALLGQVAEGEDPQEAKFLDRKAMTVAELGDLYVKQGLATRKPTSVAAARSRIGNHIKPILGSKRAALVTREDVERLVFAVAEGKTARRQKTRSRGLSRVRGGKGVANATLVTLSAMFGFGIARKVRSDNPAYRVRRFPTKKVERFLSPAELGRLGEAIAAAEALGVESPYALAAIRLLILTGCRKSEVLSAKHMYIDTWHRCLRLPDSKTGSKVVHLGAARSRATPSCSPAGKGRGASSTCRSRGSASARPGWTTSASTTCATRSRASGWRMGTACSWWARCWVTRVRRPPPAMPTWRITPVKSAADRISQEIAQLIGAEMGELPEPRRARGRGATGARRGGGRAVRVHHRRGTSRPLARYAGRRRAPRQHGGNAADLAVDGRRAGVPQDRAARGLRPAGSRGLGAAGRRGACAGGDAGGDPAQRHECRAPQRAAR
jgi:hypothetical protein